MEEFKVAYRIQSVPGRGDVRTRLLRELPLAAEVVIDDGGPPANPWRGYQKCLTDLPYCTHLVIIQDDAIVCDDFTEVVGQIVRARPDNPICLFLHGGRILNTTIQARQAWRQDARFIPLHFRDLMPVVAVVWPKHHAENFLEWSKTAKLPGTPRPIRSDDAVAGLFLRETRTQAFCCLPSIIQHLDDCVSTIGKPHRNGEDKARTAWWYEQDVSNYDWS